MKHLSKPAQFVILGIGAFTIVTVGVVLFKNTDKNRPLDELIEINPTVPVKFVFAADYLEWGPGYPLAISSVSSSTGNADTDNARSERRNRSTARPRTRSRSISTAIYVKARVIEGKPNQYAALLDELFGQTGELAIAAGLNARQALQAIADLMALGRDDLINNSMFWERVGAEGRDRVITDLTREMLGIPNTALLEASPTDLLKAAGLAQQIGIDPAKRSDFYRDFGNLSLNDLLPKYLDDGTSRGTGDSSSGGATPGANPSPSSTPSTVTSSGESGRVSPGATGGRAGSSGAGSSGSGGTPSGGSPQSPESGPSNSTPPAGESSNASPAASNNSSPNSEDDPSGSFVWKEVDINTGEVTPAKSPFNTNGGDNSGSNSGGSGNTGSGNGGSGNGRSGNGGSGNGGPGSSGSGNSGSDNSGSGNTGSGSTGSGNSGSGSGSTSSGGSENAGNHEEAVPAAVTPNPENEYRKRTRPWNALSDEEQQLILLAIQAVVDSFKNPGPDGSGTTSRGTWQQFREDTKTQSKFSWRNRFAPVIYPADGSNSGRSSIPLPIGAGNAVLIKSNIRGTLPDPGPEGASNRGGRLPQPGPAPPDPR